MLYPVPPTVGDMSAANLPANPQEEIPFLIDPYRAYRIWEVRVDYDIPTLSSITYKSNWPHREVFKSECMTQIRWASSKQPFDNPHPAPDKDHKCGIYSVKNKAGLANWTRGKKHIVMGVVLCWGRVFEYEKGFIAEYAYPLEIFDHAGNWEYDPREVLEVLGRAYGIAISV